MLSQNELLTAVSSLVRERFPDDAIYTNLVPEGFERPAFLVSCGPVQMADASCGCIAITATLAIVAFVTVDDYHNSHLEALSARMFSLLELFAVGFLRVGDRALHVVKTNGECGFDSAEMIVTLDYQDSRPSGADYPLMADIQTNLQEG